MSDEDRERPDPGAMRPRRAMERYLRRRRTDSTESSLRGWRYRLKLFADWLDGIGVTRIDQIRGYDLDEYYEVRADKIAPATLEGEMWTLKKFFEYCEQIEAVEQGMAERIRIPDLDEEDRSNDTRLKAEDALPLLRYYRHGDQFGTRRHAFLELAWITGARQSAIRGLDLRDVHLDENYVDFVYRPSAGTTLKNNRSGERPVAIPNMTSDALRTYIREYRYDVRDDQGRQPLLASMQGRPTENTVRTWSYLATQPCLHGPCPHGKDRQECKFTKHAHASKCPSSRAPHHIRTGSITWQLDQGLPPDVVAERIDATLDVIDDHYDKQSPREQMERRRRSYVDQLDSEGADEDE